MASHLSSSSESYDTASSYVDDGAHQVKSGSEWDNSPSLRDIDLPSESDMNYGSLLEDEEFSYDYEASKRRWLPDFRGKTKMEVFRFFVNWSTLKVALILLLMGFTLWLFALEKEDHEGLHLGAVHSSSPMYVDIDRGKVMEVVEVILTGEATHDRLAKDTRVSAGLQVRDTTGNVSTWVDVGKKMNLKLKKKEEATKSKYFDLEKELSRGKQWRVAITTASDVAVGLSVRVHQLYQVVNYEVIIAAVILFLVYTLIVFEVVHRTIAALVGSFWALGALAKLHTRPSYTEVISWIDFDTVGLLFGMMVMVGIFSETGFFEWIAVKAYKLSRGRIWLLVSTLCISTAVISAFLDNVTTILLLTPVTVRLCNVIDVDPIPVVVAEVLFSNVGGTATPIGDPPNILIVNDNKIKASGEVSFGNFVLHMTPGVIFAMIACYITVWCLFKRKVVREPHMGFKKEIEIWKRTAESLHESTDEELQVKRKLQLYIEGLQEELSRRPPETDVQPIDITELEAKYRITNKPLFINSCCVLSGVILLFFTHSFLPFELDLGWIAILGAMVHLVVSGIRDIDLILEKVEFGTLLFFAGLFVLMHALEELGLIEFVADVVSDIIAQVPRGDGRLAVAVLLIIWVSAIVSAFIDNIPFTAAMIPVVVSLSEDDLGLPLSPMVWALSFGCCLGGNGTLIGASANVVAAGLAEQEGHPISFNRFFLAGFPVMLTTTFAATIYMLLFHVAIPWY